MPVSELPDRLQTARTRRMLEDTAIVAASGGVLLELVPDVVDEDVFHAQVRRGDGTPLTVRLDRRLGAVELRPATRQRAVA